MLVVNTENSEDPLLLYRWYMREICKSFRCLGVNRSGNGYAISKEKKFCFQLIHRIVFVHPSSPQFLCMMDRQNWIIVDRLARGHLTPNQGKFKAKDVFFLWWVLGPKWTILDQVPPCTFSEFVSIKWTHTSSERADNTKFHFPLAIQESSLTLRIG